MKLFFNNKEISKEYYSAEPYGDGTILTINEEILKNGDNEVKVETSLGTEAVKTTKNNSTVPWSVIYALAGWNTLLTGAVAVLFVTRKKAS